MRQEFFEISGDIVKGELTLQRDVFRQAMKRFPDCHVRLRVEIARETRSSAQNRFWHGVVVPAFAEHCGYDFDDMKDTLALELLPHEITDRKTGEVRIIPGRTSKLNTKEFNELIERAQRLGAEMGIVIPDPSEVAA